MEKIRDFIPETYMPILFGAIILCVPNFFLALSLITGNRNISSQLLEIKSLQNPKIYLFADTLIIDDKNGSKGTIYLYGRLNSNLNIKRTLVTHTVYLSTGNNKYRDLENMVECTGCKDEIAMGCECLPVLRSNLHNKIYANNSDTLDEEASGIIGEIIMETYLFWIVPFLFLYYKITQLLYHYLDRKIKEKKH